MKKKNYNTRARIKTNVISNMLIKFFNYEYIYIFFFLSLIILNIYIYHRGLKIFNLQSFFIKS